MVNEEDGWKLVLDEGWLSSLPLECSWPLWAPSAGCPDRALCSPGLDLHWSSACLCAQAALPHLCSMTGEDDRAIYPGLEGDTVASEARREEQMEARSRDRVIFVVA